MSGKLGQIDTPRLTKVKGLGREGEFIVGLLTKWYRICSYIKSPFLVRKIKLKMVERVLDSLPIIA